MIDTQESTASLATRLRDTIRREGPITFFDWMNLALYDPNDGYYCRSDGRRWGREGDYRTSPECSELFAATFAGYFSKLYAELGSPEQWIILECGAGAGHFAKGALQTLQNFYPSVFAATLYVIDEVSSHSRTLARARLESFADRVSFKALDELEIKSGVIFSNELLDAFPVHRLTRQAGQLREFYVTVGRSGSFEWTMGELDPDLATTLAEYPDESALREGEILEFSLEIETWLRKVANKLAQGYVVTVDYGAHDANKRGTLRGFRRHQFVDDLLAQPGEHDLTTSVNWALVKSLGRRAGLEVVKLERLDKFLLQEGFLDQLGSRAEQTKSEAERLRVSTAAREMILPDGMGAYFQVLVQRKTYE